MSRVVIRFDSLGHSRSSGVWVDGKEIANVCGVEVKANVGETPKVVITLNAYDVGLVLDDAEVEL